MICLFPYCAAEHRSVLKGHLVSSANIVLPSVKINILFFLQILEDAANLSLHHLVLCGWIGAVHGRPGHRYGQFPGAQMGATESLAPYKRCYQFTAPISKMVIEE
jgi:hypothetical protein